MHQTMDKTLLSPLAEDEVYGAQTRGVLGMIGLLFGAWLGVNAVWGLTSSGVARRIDDRASTYRTL